MLLSKVAKKFLAIMKSECSLPCIKKHMPLNDIPEPLNKVLKSRPYLQALKINFDIAPPWI
jgi:hypothetical protein